MTSRRAAIGLLAMGLSALLWPAGGALALDYPTRSVRFVVGYPPGGATDILARLIGQQLSERLGQQFFIENKPGAGNNIGTEAVVNADAGRLHRAAGQSRQLHQRLALHQPEIRFHARYRPGSGLQPRAERHDGRPGRAGQDRRRIHRLCEGQSRQGEHGVIGQRHLGAPVGRIVHGDVGREDGARALSRRGTGDHRHAQQPRPGDLRQHALDHRAYRTRGLARAGGDDRRRVRRNCPMCRRSPKPFRATRRARCSAWARRRRRRRKSSRS